MISRRMDAERERSRLSDSDLALVGEIALLLDGGRDLGGLDAALMCLGSRTRADACELFLTTPGNQEMVLVSHQGADPDAFCQQDRFPAGEGFPGIVLATGEALTTSELPAEADFLRSRVKALGYSSALCVPLRCGTELAGCLFLAWKRAISTHRTPAHAAFLAGLPLGAAIEAARVRAGALDATGSGGARSILEERLRKLTSADDARLVIFAPDADAASADRPENLVCPSDLCPARRSGRVQVLGARSGWPHPCLQARCVCRARYCVPLFRGNDVWAVATVAFERQTPTPLTRRLPAALWVAEGLSPALPDLHHEDDTWTGAEDPAKGKRLRIRCFGGFEVWIGERLLRPSAFPRSKAYELLARLVHDRGRPATSHDLGEALWPGADPELRRNRFHVTLSALRSVIEPPSRRSRDWLHIRCDAGRYSLDPNSSVYVDLWHFDALLHQAALPTLPNWVDPATAAALGRAVRLYGGHAFEGVFQAEWAQGAARTWHNRLLRALQHLDRPDPSRPDPRTTSRITGDDRVGAPTTESASGAAW